MADERVCAGCGGRLRGVVGRNFYTCDTPGCGGNVSHFDAPVEAAESEGEQHG